VGSVGLGEARPVRRAEKMLLRIKQHS
jgi:hypothetical protein